MIQNFPRELPKINSSFLDICKRGVRKHVVPIEKNVGISVSYDS